MIVTTLILSMALGQVQYLRRSGDSSVGPYNWSVPGANPVMAFQSNDYIGWTSNIANRPASLDMGYIRGTTVNGSRAIQLGDNAITVYMQLISSAGLPACNVGNRGLMMYESISERINYCGGAGWIEVNAAPTSAAAVTQHATISAACVTTACTATVAVSYFALTTTATAGTCYLFVHTNVGGSGTVNFTLRNETTGVDIVTAVASNSANTTVIGNATALSWTALNVLSIRQSSGTPGTYNINASCTGTTTLSVN
jgi:hypothetical protein